MSTNPPPDLHVHTSNSIDAEGSQRQCVDAAIASGLPGIGFAEHWDFDPRDPSTGRFDYQGQRDSLVALIDLCMGETTIFFGGEISYQEMFESEIRHDIEGKKFDFLIGSLHHIGDTLIENMAEELQGGRPEEVYGAYFDEYLRMVRSGLFDVAGHLDYPKKFGVELFGAFEYNNLKQFIDPVLEAIIDGGMVLEINTKGWRSGVGEQYPSAEVLSQYKRMGGKYVTIGSDAHSPIEVGYNFPYAVVLANEIGLEPAGFASRELQPWPV